MSEPSVPPTTDLRTERGADIARGYLDTPAWRELAKGSWVRQSFAKQAQSSLPVG